MERTTNLYKWIILGYISIFLISLYLLLQFLLTTLFVLVYKIKVNHVDKFRIKGYQLELDGTNMNIWQLPEFYLALILSSLIVIALVYKILIRQKAAVPFNYLGLTRIDKKNRIWLFHSLTFSFICYSFWHLTGSNTGLIRIPESFLELILVIIGAVVFAPFAEEIIFRGYILTKMNELLNKNLSWISILVTSMLFALIHFQFSFANLTILFVVGLFLSIIKLKTKNLWFPILFHSIGNLVTLVLYYFL